MVHQALKSQRYIAIYIYTYIYIYIYIEQVLVQHKRAFHGMVHCITCRRADLRTCMSLHMSVHACYHPSKGKHFAGQVKLLELRS